MEENALGITAVTGSTVDIVVSIESVAQQSEDNLKIASELSNEVSKFKY